MRLTMTRVDVWEAEIDDKPGAVDRALRGIADCGADLEFLVARRLPEKPGKGLVLLAPLKGKTQTERAREAGFRRSSEMALLKILGPNDPGISSKVTQAIAGAGVSMASLTGTVYGPRFLLYAEFDNAKALTKAKTALKKCLPATKDGASPFSKATGLRRQPRL